MKLHPEENLSGGREWRKTQRRGSRLWRGMDSAGERQVLVHDRRKGRQFSRHTALSLSVCPRSSRGIRTRGVEKEGESGCVLQRREREVERRKGIEAVLKVKGEQKIQEM